MIEISNSRAESPGISRRRSSGFQSSSRQSSFVGQYARQWDSPRGSLAGVSSVSTLPRSRSPSAPHTSLARGLAGRLSNTTSPLARDNSDSNMAKIRTQKVRLYKGLMVMMTKYIVDV